MKLYLYTVLTALIAGSAHAGEVRHLKVYRDSAMISEYDTHIRIRDVRYLEVPKTIRVVSVPCTSENQVDCTGAKTLEKVPVVQAIVEYRDGVVREEDSYKTVDLEMNLPVTSFTDQQIDILKEASRPSITGRNQKIRKAFIDENLSLQITHIDKPTRVIDEDRSELCETEYVGELPPPGCKVDRHYKTKVIGYKHVQVLVNSVMPH